MDNKTVVFDVQQEIAELKRRVKYLEKRSPLEENPNYGKAVAYAQGLTNVPFDGYTAKLHNTGHMALPAGQTPKDFDIKTDPMLLKALEQMAEYFKENK